MFDTLSFLASIPLEKYCLVVEVTEEQPLPPLRLRLRALFFIAAGGVEIYLDDLVPAALIWNTLEQFSVDG